MKIVQIRGVEDDVARQFSIGASIRGITQAEYLARLLGLREAVADLDEGHPEDGLPGILEGMRLWNLGKVNA